MKELSISEIDQVGGASATGDFFTGVAIVAGAFLAVAALPAAAAIGSVVGVAALTTEVAGLVVIGSALAF
jgi:hypothetical protein